MAEDVDECGWLQWRALASTLAVPLGFGAVVGLIYSLMSVQPTAGSPTASSQQAATLHLATSLQPPESDWPAWIQAIGSVIGILIAIAIPAWQEAKRQKELRKERLQKRHDLGIALYSEVLDIQRQIEAEIKERDRYEVVEIPPAVINNLPELHLLGPAGAFLTRAVSSARSYNRKVEDIRALKIIGDLEGKWPGPLQLKKQLGLAGAYLDCEEALSALRPLFLTVPRREPKEISQLISRLRADQG